MPSVEQRRVAPRRARLRDALRPARQDDARPDCSRAIVVDRRVERQDLRVDGQLAQPARDQLRVLRAEIEDDDGLMCHVRLDQQRSARTRPEPAEICRYYMLCLRAIHKMLGSVPALGLVLPSRRTSRFRRGRWYRAHGSHAPAQRLPRHQRPCSPSSGARRSGQPVRSRSRSLDELVLVGGTSAPLAARAVDDGRRDAGRSARADRAAGGGRSPRLCRVRRPGERPR